MGLTILDQQKSVKLKKSWIRRLVREVLEILELDRASLSLVFVEREEIKKYNKQFRGVSDYTDVLSFPSGEGKNYLGDIIICPDVVRENAESYGNPFEKELALVVIHGILHLLGYRDDTEEDKAEMESKQREILELLTSFFPQ